MNPLRTTMKNPNRSGDAINLDVNLVHAVEQWRTKHGVKGDDPIIAIAELFEHLSTKLSLCRKRS